MPRSQRSTFDQQRAYHEAEEKRRSDLIQRQAEAHIQALTGERTRITTSRGHVTKTLKDTSNKSTQRGPRTSGGARADY